MPRTTGRTLALLSLLQSRREWSGTELRSRLEVSARTLRRDIGDLRGLGYGIDSVPGVGGGYRLGVGAAIPPLALSPDEAVAIAVGMRAAASTTVTGIEDAAASALVKLEQSLSPETREHISSVEKAIVPLGTAAEIDLDTLLIVARSIRECRALRIDYRRHDGEEVRRTTEAHRIVHTGTRWYVVAWIREIPDEAIREFTTRSITSAPYRHRYRVRMHAPTTEVTRQTCAVRSTCWALRFTRASA